MSSDSTKTIAIIVIVFILLAVGLLAYNSYCSECLFKMPQLKGTGGGSGPAGGGAGTISAGTSGTFVEEPGNIWLLIIPVLLIGGSLGGFGFWLHRRRIPGPHGGGGGAPGPLPIPGPPPVPPVPGPGGSRGAPPTSTPTVVAPKDWGVAIEKLADSYAEFALIEGRAAQTIFEQAVRYQTVSGGPYESFGALFGGFNSKKKNVVVPFAVPLPVYTADHASAHIKWSLVSDVADLASAEFVYGDKKAAEDMINDLAGKFASLKGAHSPNQIIEHLLVKGVFNEVTKEKLHKIGYYLDGFKGGTIVPVGWYHNHPYTTGYPKNLLMQQSGISADTGCECNFQDKWAGNNPASALVATHVEKTDANYALTLESIQLGFKFWKAKGCRRVSGKIAVDGSEDVPYKIFCMDEESYKWYEKHAPRLIQAEIVLKWYEIYYKKYVPKHEDWVSDLQRGKKDTKGNKSARPQAEGLVDGGKHLEDTGKLDEAFAYYVRAIEIDPTCGKAWWYKGAVLNAKGHKSNNEELQQEAYNCFLKAIELYSQEGDQNNAKAIKESPSFEALEKKFGGWVDSL